MRSHFYFAYGSNMNPARVVRRKMGYTLCESGTLSGYKLAFNKRSVKYPGAASANVVEHRDSHVEGVVYHLTDRHQITKMDPFEGYPVRYNRVLAPVKTVNGFIDVWVYVANPDFIEEGLKPASWYLNHLLSGCEFLSADYVEQLAGTVCLPDSELEPDP
ncbi:MAG: gamma-glutamylcyclotransferase family protein [bacterium]